MRRFRTLLLLISTAVLVGCTAPVISDSLDYATLTPLPTAERSTATPVPGGAAEVGQTFYRAWTDGDFLGMYSLLSPQSQALVDSNTFINSYEQATRTATVQSLITRPRAAVQEGTRATVEVEVVWETAVFGNIARTHNVELVYANNRWGIVWHEGLILPELVGGNTLSINYRSPARANIYDIEGKALAYQGTAVLLGVIPGEIEDEAALLATVGPLLGKSPTELKEAYADAKPDWYVPLGDIPQQTMQDNYAAIEPFIGNGLTADARPTRIYQNVAPHVVGYMGQIPTGAVNNYLGRGYQQDARVGLAGLERWGEEYLRGTPGGTLEIRDLNGRYVDTIVEVEPRQARSVYTTFDLDFQTAVEAALTEAAVSYPAGSRGAIVVLDVNTGAIKAMASYPTYDPAVFDATRPNSGDAISALFTAPSQPLLNRAAVGEYPPGSTFKIVTLAAAVRSDLYNVNTRYTSTGSWSRLGENFVKYDWREGGHGTVSLRQALVVSCNSCFYDAGFNINNQDTGLFPKVARDFGLDRPTGVIGLDEGDGIIPDPEWKVANTAEGGWVPGDAVNMAIGQGYVQVTPLQMAMVSAAVANGGTLHRPFVVDRIGEGAGTPEERIPTEVNGLLPMDADTLAAVQGAMRDVTEGRNGTATFQFEGLRVPVAGKTGTAQTPQVLPHAWFVGYAPAAPYTLPDGTIQSQPEIAIAVVMENAGEGSAVAAPIFRRIVELYYGITPVTRYPWQ